ncbi:hypothetical protein C8J57DRAFT_1223720 [Mycena rebaudengoi]|nr:hypothetical protein C8J57DRAFT_1223720 [Mycena rebaudengoi]
MSLLKAFSQLFHTEALQAALVPPTMSHEFGYAGNGLKRRIVVVWKKLKESRGRLNVQIYRHKEQDKAVLANDTPQAIAQKAEPGQEGFSGRVANSKSRIFTRTSLALKPPGKKGKQPEAGAVVASVKRKADRADGGGGSKTKKEEAATAAPARATRSRAERTAPKQKEDEEVGMKVGGWFYLLVRIHPVRCAEFKVLTSTPNYRWATRGIENVVGNNRRMPIV